VNSHLVLVVLAAFAIPLCWADWRYGKLPNALILPMYPCVAMAALIGDDGNINDVSDTLLMSAFLLCGLLVVGLPHFVVWLVNPHFLGGGDVKLAGCVGMSLAAIAEHRLAALVGHAIIVLLCVGVVAAGTCIMFRTKQIPYAPVLLLSTLATSLATSAIPLAG
jgi:leader peptidase (prepilin peptidase)/N-methyltransferase